MKPDLHLLQKSLTLTNRSYAVIVYSILLSILGVFLKNFRLVSLLFFFVMIGWIGTQIALVQDVFEKDVPNFSKLKHYFLKYLPRFLPLVLIYVLVGIVGVFILLYVAAQQIKISGYSYVNSYELITLAVKNIPELINTSLRDPKFLIPLSIVGAIVGPYFTSFAPIVVVKDISFWKAIAETLTTLKNNSKLYWGLFWVSAINSLIYHLYYLILPNTSFYFSGFTAEYFVRLLFNTYIHIFTISIVLVYLLQKKSTK